MNTRLTNLDSWVPLTKVVLRNTPSRKYRLYALAANARREYVVQARRTGKYIMMDYLARRNRGRTYWTKERDSFYPSEAPLIRALKYEEVVGILLSAIPGANR